MAVIYYIGTKDKDTKDYKLTNESIKQTIMNEFIKEYPLGFTITEGMGCFKGNKAQSNNICKGCQKGSYQGATADFGYGRDAS